MITSLFSNFISIKALDTKDLKQYIVSGKGTQEDSSILSEECPYLETMDNYVREIIQPSIEPAVDFSGTLTGEVHYNEVNDGVWEYEKGGPDKTVD